MYAPFTVRVARTERISPHFQRITFHGVDDMGPAETIRDLRIKLIIPGPSGLPCFESDSDWYALWTSLDPATRGNLRTYSVRAFRRPQAPNAAGTPLPAELDIDFVIHAEDPGPASAWAASASEGDELIVIAPTRDDDSGRGIEFAPGDNRIVRMLGDETTLPAIAKTLQEWPEGVRGDIYIEVPTSADVQTLELPDAVGIHWLPRDAAGVEATLAEPVECGELLMRSLELLGHELGVGDGVGDVDADAGGAESGADVSADGGVGSEEGVSVSAGSGSSGVVASTADEPLVWETPSYSSDGEDLGAEGSAAQKATAQDGAKNAATTHGIDDTYYWIAGEAGAVVKMRRMLVREWGVPRGHVSFMGYWKRGVAAKD
ncbi:siderophore-interacting protein [Corynebacterium lactis]|uniref:Side tail fiber protein n=1 Tax=Corynebacterium lactis RW2-5 TaxID=1408189 RepID=A0A0K2H2G5_9CORY|nr:siderophore-interacting protein [Corynebacterium lactis]ALA68222.1 side tail fiber protein [Corynebacterium lactis RW2-5]